MEFHDEVHMLCCSTDAGVVYCPLQMMARRCLVDDFVQLYVVMMLYFRFSASLLQLRQFAAFGMLIVVDFWLSYLITSTCFVSCE